MLLHHKPLLSFIFGIVAYGFYPYFPFLSLLLPFLFFIFFKNNIKHSLLAISFFCIGFAYSSYAWTKPPDTARLAGMPITAVVYPISVSSQPEDSSKIYVQTVSIVESSIESLQKVREISVISPFALSPKYLYLINGKIPSDVYLVNPYGRTDNLKIKVMSIQNYQHRQMSYFESIRWQCNEFFSQYLSKDAGAFIMAIITGDRSLLSFELKDAFNKTGLTHILSISGSHFGLLLFITFFITRSMLSMMPETVLNKITLHLDINKCSAFMCLPIIITYYMIAVYNVPAFRSFIMIIISIAGLILYRGEIRLNSIIVAATIVLLTAPETIIDLSFQLSFISVLGIAYIIEHTHRADTECNSKKLISFLKNSISVSLVATISTSALTIYHFYGLSMLSPLSNLIFVPIIGIIILPIALISALIYLTVGSTFMAMPLDIITHNTLLAISFFAQDIGLYIRLQAIPTIIILIYYTALLYIFISNLNLKKSAVILCLSLVALIAFFTSDAFVKQGLKVTFLDVGQGDSIVIQIPDKRVFVIDTGKSGLQTATFISALGKSKIDVLMLTHSDLDHTGGLKSLSRRFVIKEIWDNGNIRYNTDITQKDIKDSETITTKSDTQSRAELDFAINNEESRQKIVASEITYRQLSKGDIITVGKYQFIVLHPSVISNNEDKLTENNLSLVVKLIGIKNSFLFASDIEQEAIDDILQSPELLKSNVYKVAHHGSVNSLDEVFISAVEPKIAVISVGRANPYAHPHLQTLNALEGIKLYRTDIDGAVGFVEDDNGKLSVITAERFRLKKAYNVMDEWQNLKRLFCIW